MYVINLQRNVWKHFCSLRFSNIFITAAEKKKEKSVTDKLLFSQWFCLNEFSRKAAYFQPLSSSSGGTERAPRSDCSPAAGTDTPSLAEEREKGQNPKNTP